jgi:chromosome segregation ATPase
MLKGKGKNLTNRNQNNSPSSEPSTSTSASPGYLNTPEKQDSDLKSYLMMLVEDFKKSINNSLKEIQENTAKEVEVLKEETQKSLKELQENTTKQVMKLNKAIQDLKREVETIKKTQRETTLEIESLGKKSGTIEANISNRIQEMEERNSGAEDSIGKNGHNNQRKCKTQKAPNPKHPGIPGHKKKTKPTDNRSR